MCVFVPTAMARAASVCYDGGSAGVVVSAKVPLPLLYQEPTPDPTQKEKVDLQP